MSDWMPPFSPAGETEQPRSRQNICGGPQEEENQTENHINLLHGEQEQGGGEERRKEQAPANQRSSEELSISVSAAAGQHAMCLSGWTGTD